MEEKAVPEIALTPVQSSQIHAVGYDAGSRTLRIQFKSAGGPGSTYDYPGVPADKHADFLKAESVGKFFGAHIKGKFDFKKLPVPKKVGG
jgi:hypothetical protein